MQERAFTIIEVLVVLLLVAMMAAFAALSLRGSDSASTLGDAIDHIQHLDRITRDRAERTGQTHTLVVNLDQPLIQISDTPKKAGMTMVAFGNDVRPTALWLSNRPITAGKTAIAYQPNGGSPDFAITISSTSAPAKRLLFIGATGQVVEIENDENLTAFFKMQKSPARDDAD